MNLCYIGRFHGYIYIYISASQYGIVIKKSIDHNQIVLLQFIDGTKNKSWCHVIAVAIAVGSSRIQNGIGEVMSACCVAM
jgi:hypothetical protein